MQEEVENRTLTLVVSGTKLTGRLFMVDFPIHANQIELRILEHPFLSKNLLFQSNFQDASFSFPVELFEKKGLLFDYSEGY